MVNQRATFLAFIAAVIFCSGVASTLAGPTTSTDAVREARKMPRQDPRQTTSDTTASQTVPNYGTANYSSMSNLYQNGNGDLQTNGQQRVGSCSNQGDPECQAVNTVQNGKAQRPTFTIQSTDPMITNADQTRRNASSIVGLSPGGVSEPTKQCTTVTKNNPGTTFDETCDIATPAASSTCDVVWDTVVDHDANYRCETVAAQLQTYNCDKALNVTVTYTQACQINSVTPLVPEIGTTVRTVACDAALNAQFTLQIAAAYECHSGGCNSNYFPIQFELNKGVPASGTTQLGGDYQCGGLPCYITFTWTYDGNQSVSINEMGDSGNFGAPTFGGSGFLLPAVCPSGTSFQALPDGTWACAVPPVAGACAVGALGTYCDANGCSDWCVAAATRHGLDYLIDGGRYQIPNVTETWVDGCAALEARL